MGFTLVCLMLQAVLLVFCELCFYLGLANTFMFLQVYQSVQTFIFLGITVDILRLTLIISVLKKGAERTTVWKIRTIFLFVYLIWFACASVIASYVMRFMNTLVQEYIQTAF